jgi:rhodanese-related sulfurtransferase
MFRSLFGGRGDNQFSTVNAPEFKRRIVEEDDLLIVDVRSLFEYEHDGHIDGALLLPLQDLMLRYEELPQDRPIVFVCRSGNRSHVACEQMVRFGYSNISNFIGGMIAWKQAGYQVD